MILHLAAILSAWLQYEADGQPHARVVGTTSCPTVAADERLLPMHARAGAIEGFNDIVCDVAIPATAKRVRIGQRTLPAPVARLERIVVLGDTGCRINGLELQNCNNPVDWPFPVIARSITKLHPDLIVHVGDYLYRESACPPFDTGCAGSPFGDIAQAWTADWFAPAAPMLASAPVVLIRGNHEDCTRAGPGWFRYLDGGPATECEQISQPYAVDFPGLRLVVFDSAGGDDLRIDGARLAEYKQTFSAARKLTYNGPDDRWLITHRPPYLNNNERTAMGSTIHRFSAVLSGHIHLFAGLNVEGLPPLVINGEGGDNLDTMLASVLTFGLGNLHSADAPFTEPRFGFGLYTRIPSGWLISLRNTTGNELARCALTRRTVHCTAKAL